MSLFSVLLFLFLLGDVLWISRAGQDLPSPALRWIAGIWGAAMLAGLAAVIAGRFTRVMLDDVLPRPLLSIVFIWHLLIVPVWLLWHSGRGIVCALRRLSARPALAPEAGMSRREFLTAATTFAPAVLATGSALAAEKQLGEFRVRKLEVPVTDLPAALEGFPIAQVSDVHVGRFTRGRVLEQIVATANDLQPDLTVLTGDLINFAMRDLPVGIDLARGLRARHGVYLCEGNHDLFEDAAGFRRRVARAGLGFLRDESATLDVNGGKVQLAGVRWTHGDAEHAAALSALGRMKAPGAFPILLAHHPHVFDFAGGFPLVLAGHTHGGQLMAGHDFGFGPWMFRYWSGLYQRDGRALVVSNGVGNWFPVRIGAPAEIVQITLRRAS